MDRGTDLLVPLAIALIMFGIGLSLNFKDFKRVFLRPKAILVGLACQFILLPLVAFIMAWLLPIDPYFKVGLVLIASAPGGTASNLVTHMLKGRVALSVSMTSFNSLGILLTIPIYLSLAMHWFLHNDTQIEIGFADTFREILLTVVLPVVGGVLSHEYGSRTLIESLQQPLRYILPLLLLAVFGFALFLDNGGEQTTAFWDNIELFFPLLFFNAFTMALGFLIAQKAGIKHSGAFTIAVEMGLQNAALAIFIATSVLQNSDISLVAVIYSSFTFFSTWLFAWLLKHRLKPFKSTII